MGTLRDLLSYYFTADVATMMATGLLGAVKVCACAVCACLSAPALLLLCSWEGLSSTYLCTVHGARACGVWCRTGTCLDTPTCPMPQLACVRCAHPLRLIVAMYIQSRCDAQRAIDL